jgi:hypothetical protein
MLLLKNYDKMANINLSFLLPKIMTKWPISIYHIYCHKCATLMQLIKQSWIKSFAEAHCCFLKIMSPKIWRF